MSEDEADLGNQVRLPCTGEIFSDSGEPNEDYANQAWMPELTLLTAGQTVACLFKLQSESLYNFQVLHFIF